MKTPLHKSPTEKQPRAVTVRIVENGIMQYLKVQSVPHLARESKHFQTK